MDVDVSLFIQTLEVGGAQRVMVNLANGFAAEGYTTDLVLVTESGDFLKEVSEDVRIVDLGATRTVTSIPPLRRYFQDVAPSTMISAMTHTNVAALIANVLAGSSTDIVVTEHGDFVKRYEYMVERRKELFVATIAGLLYPRADYVVANSQTVKDGIVENTRVSENAVEVIPNPVVTDDLNRQKELPVDERFQALDEPIIISVGRLVPKKDYPTLLRAFSQLCEDTEATLVIIGDGRSRSDLEELAIELNIDGQVKFTGEIQNPFPYMARSSVFALPSATEAFGNVIVEAMACGCPVVATRSSTGPATILNDGEYGRLTPVGDASAMAKALRAELAEPTPEPVLQSRAADFSVDAILPRFEALL
jgi:glycosyltransferase involved in cell wall biosynthesis